MGGVGGGRDESRVRRRRINSRMPYCIREGNAKVLKTTDSIEKLGFLNHESGFDKRMFYVTNKREDQVWSSFCSSLCEILLF